MTNAISFLLDGSVTTLEFSAPGVPPPTTTVLQYLRSLPGHTGTKEGCAEGDCGACTVVLAIPDGKCLRYEAVDACLLFLPMLHGRQLITVENLKSEDGRLHPVQSALCESYGSQCGFCTPGIVMSLFALFKRKGTPDECEIRAALAGNLCRCTGYRPIIEAARRVCGSGGRDQFSDGEEGTLRMLQAIPSGSIDLSSGSSRYARPGTLADALRLRRERPSALLLSGGTDIAVRVTKKHETLDDIIDLSGLRELTLVEHHEHALVIGAAVTIGRLKQLAGTLPASFRELIDLFGSAQIRSMATLGGNIGTASPVGDALPLLMAHEGEIILATEGGERGVPAAEFVTGYRTTACRSDEIIRAVRIPITPRGVTTRWYKVSKRRDVDIATISGGFRLELDRDQTVARTLLAFGGMADRPRRATVTEEFLCGKPWTRSTVERALPLLDADFAPISDVRGTAGMRQIAARNLLLKFWADTVGGLPNLPGDAHGADAASIAPPSPDETSRVFHESAGLHVTGEALYVDDIVPSSTLLAGKVVYSPHAHARIVSFDLDAARSIPGVYAVLSARDIPGENQMGPVVHDEPCLAADTVQCVGQAVFLIAAESEELCRAAEGAITVQYEPLPAILSIDDAIAQNTLLGAPRSMGTAAPAREAIGSSPHVVRGEVRTGAQEHWYLESQVCLCMPGEQNELRLLSSTQNPNETQGIVAEVLGIGKHEVTVEVRRMGGAFGGKETQANHVACWAALLAQATLRPVRIRLCRDDDMIITGKRHRFLSRYEAGFDDDGNILALRVDLNSDAGAATDLSHAIMERAMLHADNAYFIPAMEVQARVWKTNLPSNTAMRGFGGPQGMAVVETVIDRVARILGKDAADVRRLNFYREAPADVTHYGQTVSGNHLPLLYDRLMASSGYRARRAAVEAYNGAHEFTKRGLALTPVKFGISFTTTFLNQAGALVLIYDDGTVLVNHGGTEMGQGLHTKIRQIAATELGLPIECVKISPTDTSKVPNTSPTAASSGTDLNGAAVRNALDTLKRRIAEGLAPLFSENHPAMPTDPGEIVFREGTILDGRHRDRTMTFADAMARLRQRQVSLSATGFYRTPGIGWDKTGGRGTPFAYYAFGMAVSEVSVDLLTGRVALIRTDILHDVGDSINHGIDIGQIEGGFIQGLGWVTTEEIVWDDRGRLLSHSPDTYKIPTANDLPADFRVATLENVPNPTVVGRSKAVGEPPFMLALSVWLAIKDAVSAAGGHSHEPQFSLPATTEVILRSLEDLTARKVPS